MLQPTSTTTPAAQDGYTCPCCGVTDFQGTCHSRGYGIAHASQPWIPSAQYNEKCPYCGASTFVKSVMKVATCGMDLQDADTRPRCGASGFQGQCHSCGYNPGIGT